MSGMAHRAAAMLNAEAAGSEPLHGGDLSVVNRVTLTDGRSVIAKTGPAARTEADMLAAIAATGAPAPAVLAVADDLLVMEDLGRDEGLSGAWGDLGRVLRSLHESAGDSYGWPVDHAFGALTIPNGPLDDWCAFWVIRRLAPFFTHVPDDLADRIGTLIARLPDVLPQHPPPALLHGDLWTGNLMARDGRITGLIDPACYYGDAEVDLAMLSLFGSPGPAFRAAYGSLDRGWERRRAVYQLWPALVHLRLFGDGYRGLVIRCLKDAGA